MSVITENQACIVIAIAGASASGKSLIASTIYKELKEELGSDDIGIIPEYDYAEHNRKTTTTRFDAKKIIILEGILLLTDEEIRNEINVSIFVDAPLDICFIRRLQRDMVERGRTMESVIAQYRKTVRPMFLQFIEPSKQYADIIVPKGGKNRIAINILKAQIQQLLGKK